MITRLNLAEQLTEYQISSKLHWRSITFSSIYGANKSRNFSTKKFSTQHPDLSSRKLTTSSKILSDSSVRILSHSSYSTVPYDGTGSILQAASLQHWFKKWHEQRRHKLTASTFAGAIGFWPHRRVQLWLEKLGAIEPFPGNLATCWNNIKEEQALERYKLITGNTVLFPEFQVYGKNNPEHSWLGASPDGLVDGIVYDLPSRGVLEIKCPYFGGDKEKAFPWSRVPLYYIPQAQGLMEIMDKDWIDFYVWTENGSSLSRISRDKDYWDVLKIALSDFWWKHVHPAREWCNNYTITDPLTQLRFLKPAPRHESCGRLVCESRRIANTSKLLLYEIRGQLQF